MFFPFVSDTMGSRLIGVVHAKGAGAFGYFEVTNDAVITKICKADMFQGVGKRTPVAVRFSTVGGESGSADTARDPRGFAVKFYTNEGNWVRIYIYICIPLFTGLTMANA